MDFHRLISVLVSFSFVVILPENNAQHFSASNPSIDPMAIFQPQIHKQNIIKENCAWLCNECNGSPQVELNVCRCRINTDYPNQCLERIQRKARTVGLTLKKKYPARAKRRAGVDLGELGLPNFGTVGRTADGQIGLTNVNEQLLGDPSEMFQTLSGIVTAPLIEQLRAVFSGDGQTAEETVPGQILNHLPNALSSLTNLLDTFNVGLPSPRRNILGAGRSADGSSDSTTDDVDIEKENTLRALKSLNQLRAMFIGDPNGGVEKTLPVQLASSLPKALGSAIDLFDSFSVGSPKRNNGGSAVGKSWLKEFDDDDDDKDNDKSNTKSNRNKLLGQKLIVSPFKSNGQPSTSDANISEQSRSVEDVFANIGALSGSGDSQIIQPEETIIILSPIRRP